MIVEAICDLHKRGFTSDFSMLDGRLFCCQQQSFLEDEQYDIVEVQSFDSRNSKDQETILYAIEWFTKPVKGILLDSKSSSVQILSSKLKRFWK